MNANTRRNIKKILILAANPENASRFRLRKEAREIEKRFEQSKTWAKFDVRYAWATRPRDIRLNMLDFAPHVVHFSGHG